MRLMTILFAGFLSSSALAAPLATVQPLEATSKQVTVQTALSCDEVPQEIKRLEVQLQDLFDQNLRAFDDMVYVMHDWYRTLSRYEGRTVAFRYGYFRPIMDSAYTIDGNRRHFSSEFRFVLDRLRDTQIMSEDCAN